MAWIDRMGCMEFIHDQALMAGKSQPAYSRAAYADHDDSAGLHEYAVWFH